jgi:hypothetical protein
MAIRTVLVGLVAALSLTLPSGKQIESWKQQAQAWMNARLAEWDARMPAGENAFVYVAEPISPPRIAPQRASKVEVATVEAKPEERESTAPRTSEESAIAALADAASALAIPTEPMPLEEQEIRVASEVIPAPLALPLPLPIPAAEDAAFHAALDDTLAVFIADLNRPVAPSAIVAEAAAPAPEEVVGTLEEPEVDLAFEFSRSTEGLCLLNEVSPRPSASVPPEAVAALPVPESASADEFDPIAVFGLDQESEGEVSSSLATVAEVASASPVSVSAPAPAVDPLARAVRLTGEAVYAWASLLTGPAVVTASH